ncbi:MAG TPA: NUDIX hydrolase [Runella sp.]|nr:NUDIX hydrolase [Runella sp.]
MKVRPAALIIENNHLLLLRYNYSGNDVFALPGGNPDRGETLPQTIERELSEELGIEVEVQGMLFSGEVLLPHQKDDVLHVVFGAQIIGGIPRLNPNETTALEICWKPVNVLHQLNLYPNVGQYIQDGLLGSPPHPYVGQINQPFFS